MSKMNPNAKPFVPGSSSAVKPSPIPVPPAKGPKGPITAAQAGKKLDASDARTAGNKSPAHNRSQHVGKTGAQLAARNKPIATSYLTKDDQNKAAAALMNSAKGQQKKAELKGEADGKTRTVTGTSNTGPAKPGANWNKTAVITKVTEKQADGSTRTYNAKATTHQMDLSKKGGKVNVQTTYATKGGLTELPKPMAANAPRAAKVKPGFDQSDYSSVTKNAKPGMVKPAKPLTPVKGPVSAAPGKGGPAKPATKSWAAVAGGKK